jgi:hypothetical protein
MIDNGGQIVLKFIENGRQPAPRGHPHRTSRVSTVLGAKEQDWDGGIQAQGVAAGLREEL